MILGSVNLRKSYSCELAMINIEISKTKDKTKRYCLFFLYLYFLDGLSYRNTIAKALYGIVDKSHVSIWKWMQKYKLKKRYHLKEKELMSLLYMKLKLKLVPNTFGYDGLL